jgi:chaperone required for assembly of F1-ATPase
MKRFWKAAEPVEREGGWTVELDGRPLRTPAKAVLVLTTAALAESVAKEWFEAGETVDPRAMPLTGLANAAIDLVAPDPAAFAAGLAKYGESDLLCYRAEAPAVLAEREAAAWDPLLSWARRRFDVDFRVTVGISHVPQPEATVTRLAHAVATLDPFRLAALSPLVGVAVTPDQAWQALTVDERWQAEQWGADPEAEAVLEGRRREFMAAASFLELLDL